MVKRVTSPFNSFCSNVAKQVARFLLPVFAYLYYRNNEQQTTAIGKAWSCGTWCLLLAVNGILNPNTVIALNGLFEV